MRSVGPTPEVTPLVWTFSGALAVTTGTLRIYNDTGRAWQVVFARAYVDTAPTGAAAVFAVKKNGSAAITLTVDAAANTVTSSGVVTVAAGDYLTADITQVGSTVAGADATVVLSIAG